jgi:hypothetical protein
MRQETLEVNGYKVVLPIGLPEPLTTKVRDSYQTFLRESTNDVVRHLTCFSTLVPPMLETWGGGNRVLHPFGGLGACAQIMDQAMAGYPPLLHTFWDRDPECVAWLARSRGDVSLVPDSFKLLQTHNLVPYRAIMLDLSVNTIKTPTTVPMWEKIADWMDETKFVWFTDTACHKMHLNWRSYARDFGKEIEKSNFSYMQAYSEWLEYNFGITILKAMAEAGMTYCVAALQSDDKRFSSIPYV